MSCLQIDASWRLFVPWRFGELKSTIYNLWHLSGLPVCSSRRTALTTEGGTSSWQLRAPYRKKMSTANPRSAELAF